MERDRYCYRIRQTTLIETSLSERGPIISDSFVEEIRIECSVLSRDDSSLLCRVYISSFENSRQPTDSSGCKNIFDETASAVIKGAQLEFEVSSHRDVRCVSGFDSLKIALESNQQANTVEFSNKGYGSLVEVYKKSYFEHIIYSLFSFATVTPVNPGDVWRNAVNSSFGQPLSIIRRCICDSVEADVYHVSSMSENAPSLDSATLWTYSEREFGEATIFVKTGIPMRSSSNYRMILKPTSDRVEPFVKKIVTTVIELC